MKAVVLTVLCLATAIAVPLSTTRNPVDLAALRDRLLNHAHAMNEIAHAAEPDLLTASSLLGEGICAYKGFCRTNPASSCMDVLNQGGVSNQTVLPDGKYWITPVSAPGSPGFGQSLAVQVNCLMSAHGGGWMLLFDDSLTDEVKQLTNPLLMETPFTEVLAFTPNDVRNSGAGRRTFLYFVDSTRPTEARGHTPAETFYAPWIGQDDYGKMLPDNTYPERAKHYRFKYFGKPAANFTNTLYILDDGDIGPSECKTGKVVESGKGKCYNDAPGAKFPQVCYNGRGILSFGCSNNRNDFTQCGTCRYSGYGPKADVIRNSIVQRLYAR